MAGRFRRYRFFLAFIFLLLLNHAPALAGDAVLTWNANSEADLAGYRVYVGLRTGFFNLPVPEVVVRLDVGKVTTWTVPNLAEGLTYYFVVTAYDTAGNESAPSNEGSKAIPILPDTTPPLISSITASNLTATSAIISWGTNEPADTRIEYGTTLSYGSFTPLASALLTVHSQSLSNLVPGTLYHYRVHSRDAAGNLATSADHILTTPPSPDSAAPTVPGSLTATAVSSSRVNLSWGASTDNVGVTGYRVERCQGAGCSNFTQVGTSAGTTYSESGLAAAASFSYRVRATDAAANLSLYSNTATVATPALPPPAPIQGLAAAYAFNEGSGTTAVNASGGISGTLVNGPLWSTQGKFGNALSFDGVNDVVSVADNATLDLGGTGTFEAWVNLRVLNRWQGVIAKGSANSNAVHNYALEITAANRAMCILGNGSAAVSVSSTVTMAAGQFRHLACSWNGTTLSLYVDGVLNSSTAQSLTPAGNGAPLSIGQYGGSADPLNGFIDEVRIYNRALTQAEIQQDMNTPITGGAPSDATAPTVPAGLTAAALSSTQINLSWSASTDNVGVTGYRIYRNGVEVAARTTLTYSDAGLTPNTLYSYTVAAQDAAGNLSPQSTAVSARTLPPPDTTAPVISGVAVGSITANGALIIWGTNEPADTQVEYGTTAAYGSSTPTVPALVTAHSQSVAGLLPSTLYHYRVRSRDAAGNLAISTDGIFTTAPAPDTTPPSTPNNVAGAAVSSSRINLSWSASTDNIGVTGYRIYRNGVQVGAAALASYADTGLAPNTAYSYTVGAIDAAGNLSALSTAVSVTTLPLVPSVSGAAAANLTPTSATLSGAVNPSGAATSAWFEYGTTTAYGSSTVPVSLSAATTLSSNLTGLTPGITYHFRIVARNAGGTTFGTDTLFNTPVPPAPAPPPSAPITGYRLTQEPFSWVETPTVLAFSGDDTATAVSIPFSFPFYGQSHQQLYLSTNGLITFGAPNTAYLPQPIPSPTLPNAFIAPFWRDLYVGLRQISIASSNSELVISFNGVRDLCCDVTHTFQVILRPDGTILMQYGTVALNVRTTFGIENQDGNGVAIPSVSSNSAFRFTPNTVTASP